MSEVLTDSSGHFTAAFDLRFEPSLEADRKKWKKAKAILKGIYRAQARIVVVDEVASVESAMVFIQTANLALGGTQSGGVPVNLYLTDDELHGLIGNSTSGVVDVPGAQVVSAAVPLRNRNLDGP